MNTSFETSIRLTKLLYVLQALCIFLYLPCIIGQVVNYVYRPEVRNTWLESHLIWQARTFWFGMVWLIISGVLCFVLIGFPMLVVTALWIIYRVVTGFSRLSLGRPRFVV